MIETTLFLFLFIMILLLICFTALICILEVDNDTGNNKRLYRKNEKTKRGI